MGAALRHAFEAVDREILVRCRLEGNKSGATGVAVLRIGEPGTCKEASSLLQRGVEVAFGFEALVGWRLEG